MRDKSHMESTIRWAEFVRDNPRDKWKPYVNLLIEATYQKADEFFERMRKTDKGKDILKRLMEERIKMR